MARSVMEGVAFQNALILKEFEKTGSPLNEFRITGGGARSALWSQIQADIYGKPVHRLKEDEAGLLGAAILAGVGAQIFNSIEEGVAQMVNTLESFTPNPDCQTVYEKELERFNQLYKTIYDS